jgi:hypothetical protein
VTPPMTHTEETNPIAWQAIVNHRLDALERAYERTEQKLNALLGGLALTVLIQLWGQFSS